MDRIKNIGNKFAALVLSAGLVGCGTVYQAFCMVFGIKCRAAPERGFDHELLVDGRNYSFIDSGTTSTDTGTSDMGWSAEEGGVGGDDGVEEVGGMEVLMLT